MKLIIFEFLGLIYLTTACSTNNDHLLQHSSMNTDEVTTRNKGATSSRPVTLTLNEIEAAVLDDKDWSINIEPTKNLRSYYELFEAKSSDSEQFVEIYTWPSKAAFSFDAGTILSPSAVFYDSKGKEINSTSMILQEEAHTYIDENFLRTVWKLSQLKKGQKFYILITSKNDDAGKQGGYHTNYSGAILSPALTTNSGVPFGPTGPFKILHTDKFKK